MVVWLPTLAVVGNEATMQPSTVVQGSWPWRVDKVSDSASSSSAWDSLDTLAFLEGSYAVRPAEADDSLKHRLPSKKTMSSRTS